MKVSRNLQEFYVQNDKDVNKLLHKHFKNILQRFSLEDIKNEIYERLISKKYIEDYRPFRIYIDKKNNIWEFKPAEAKFSTYIFTFMKNYILAYYGNRKHYEDWLSLDEFNDRGFTKNNDKKIKYEEKYYENDNINFQLDIEDFLKKLEKKTKNKGTIICNNDIELSISKYLDNTEDKGCTEEDLFNSIKICDKKIFTNVLNTLLEKNFIRKEVTQSGQILYFLDQPDRRSLYSLFKFYLDGYKDKEISEKFNMTVAGVGALKRSLRKEISQISKNWKEV
jgi:DNA-directed RNA polymerase specialized sigma24 family protein